MRPRPSGPARATAGCAGIAAAVVLAGCAGSPSGSAPEPAPASSGLAMDLYLDPRGEVPTLLATAREAGRSDDAAYLERLAQPTASWFTGQHADPGAAARELTTAAEEDGTLPVLVLYNVPGRDCGLYSAGGAADATEYRGWVDAVAAGLGDRPALVVLEPDAVPQALTGCEGLGDPQERYALLADAVEALGAAGGTRVYLDAGNASWVEDTGALAAALEDSGLASADGFALNTSNFQTTEDSAAYGRRLSEAAGGARFVIDTSRNGAGPAPDDGSGLQWCNPRGRRTGEAPTTDSGLDGVDALLWVKQPGDSDGACRPGEPPAGEFWPEYARELVG